jgi:hypothetical protein
VVSRLTLEEIAIFSEMNVHFTSHRPTVKSLPRSARTSSSIPKLPNLLQVAGKLWFRLILANRMILYVSRFGGRYFADDKLSSPSPSEFIICDKIDSIQRFQSVGVENG